MDLIPGGSAGLGPPGRPEPGAGVARPVRGGRRAEAAPAGPPEGVARPRLRQRRRRRPRPRLHARHAQGRRRRQPGHDDRLSLHRDDNWYCLFCIFVISAHSERIIILRTLTS